MGRFSGVEIGVGVEMGVRSAIRQFWVSNFTVLARSAGLYSPGPGQQLYSLGEVSRAIQFQPQASSCLDRWSHGSIGRKSHIFHSHIIRGELIYAKSLGFDSKLSLSLCIMMASVKSFCVIKISCTSSGTVKPG